MKEKGNKLWRWWLNACSTGGTHIIDEQEKERYTKVNQFAALMTLILFSFIPVFHYYALPQPDLRITIGITVYTALNGLAWYLNSRWKKTLRAAWLLYLTTCFAVGYFGILMGTLSPSAVHGVLYAGHRFSDLSQRQFPRMVHRRWLLLWCPYCNGVITIYLLLFFSIPSRMRTI